MPGKLYTRYLFIVLCNVATDENHELFSDRRTEYKQFDHHILLVCTVCAFEEKVPGVQKKIRVFLFRAVWSSGMIYKNFLGGRRYRYVLVGQKAAPDFELYFASTLRVFLKSENRSKLCSFCLVNTSSISVHSVWALIHSATIESIQVFLFWPMRWKWR